MGARPLLPLVAGLAIGFALGWFVRDGTRSPTAGAVPERTAPGAPSVLPEDRPPPSVDPSTSLGAVGRRPIGSEPPPSPTTDAGATSEADLAGPALPFVELTVVAGPGTPPDWKATAYLLAAGAKGAEKPEELPHGEVTVDRPVRLVAPQDGLYDVGLVNEAMQLLETDVRATPEGTRIRVTLPPMAPVKFRLANGVPPDEPNTKISGFVSLERPPDPSKWNDLPGRGEYRSRGPLVHVRGDAGATFETPPILERETFTLDLDFRETHTEGNTTSFDFSVRWELMAEPRTVRGGDLVTLSVVSLGTLELAMTAAPPAVEFPSRLEVALRRAEDGAYHGWRGSGDRDGTAVGPRRELKLPLGPGRWTVTWSGPGVVPGRLENVEIRPGAPTQRAVELRAAAPAGTEDEEEKKPAIPIEVDPPLAEKEGWSVFARQGDTWPFHGRGNGSKRPEVSGDLRGKPAVLVIGGDRVSAEEVVPATGPWRPRLVRPGFVLFTPTRTLDPGQGALTVRRPDGFPIPLSRERRGSPEFRPELEARVTPGLLLGPFAPGPLELEVFAARTSLGVVRLSIVAGGIAPLSIPGR